LTFHLSVKAQPETGKQVEAAKFEIVKATVEFLASDRETFKEAKETVCMHCEGYSALLQFVQRNKIKKADDLIRKWREEKKVDTTSANRNKSLERFKREVIGDITTGLPGYLPYTVKLDPLFSLCP
jgi:hypothetical protein